MTIDEQIVIGFEDDVACGAEETRRQIEELMQHECCLCAGSADQPLGWDDLYDPDERESVLHYVINDRLHRVDQGLESADRPPFCVATVCGGAAVRLEFYAGHDALELTGELRSPELLDSDLPPYLSEDPYHYDPIEFIRETVECGLDTNAASIRYWTKRGIDPFERGFQIRLSLPGGT
jgi:hypothetical protein